MELEERVSTQSDGSLGDRREEGDICIALEIEIEITEGKRSCTISRSTIIL